MRDIRVSAKVFYIAAALVIAMGVAIFLMSSVMHEHYTQRWWGLLFGLAFIIWGRLMWRWTRENDGR